MAKEAHTVRGSRPRRPRARDSLGEQPAQVGNNSVRKDHARGGTLRERSQPREKEPATREELATREGPATREEGPSHWRDHARGGTSGEAWWEQRKVGAKAGKGTGCPGTECFQRLGSHGCPAQFDQDSLGVCLLP